MVVAVLLVLVVVVRLHHYAKDESGVSNIVGGGGTASMPRTIRLPPPSLKPTIQQIFPPSERAPPNLGGLPTTLVCMKECDIEKFATDNLNLHSKGIFRKKVLADLVHFLQQFSYADVVSCTKMDSSNLAMVFAPNCCRCTSDDPKMILENARKEMAFMRTLIQNMDATHIANLT